MLRAVLPMGWLLSLSSCADAYCDEPQRVVSSSSTEPGSLRAGVRFHAHGASIAARSGGSVICLTCTALVTLDQRASETARIEANPPRHVAVASDGTIYAILGPPVENADTLDLTAFEPNGTPRWTVSFDEYLFSVVAGAEGAYIERRYGSIDAGVRIEYPVVALFDAASGQPRELPISPQYLLGAAREGIFTSETQESSPVSITLRHVDRDDRVAWARTVTSPSFFFVSGAIATPSGGGIFLGSAEDAVDFGDHKLDGESRTRFAFVFELDDTGATRWAFKKPGQSIRSVALADDGQILLAGSIGSAEGSDAYLAVATPTGIVRTHRITGPGDQLVTGLATSSDGLAWLQVDNRRTEDHPPPVMHIADREFDDSGTYLFAIVP